jgi:ABC-type lipoprotein release transport system permease subunit
VKKMHAAGFRASARLLAGGLAAAGDASAGVSFRGVKIADDASVSMVHRQVDQGAWLDSADPKGVVVGRRLARTLGVEPGDELVVLSQGADGSMANELYRVRGVLRSIGDAVDRSGVYITQQTFRELFVLDAPRESGGAHQIVVRRPEQMPLDAAAARLRAPLSTPVSRPELEVKTWRELMPMIASYLDQARGMIGIFVFIVFVAIGIVILNAMLMAVFERIREFGVLKALGMGPGGVLRLIVMESIYLTGLAVVFGCILSALPLWYLARVGLDLSSMGDLTIQGLAWDPIWRASVDLSI